MSRRNAQEASLVLVARDAGAFDAVADDLRVLAQLHGPVVLVAGGGALSPQLSHLAFRHEPSLIRADHPVRRLVGLVRRHPQTRPMSPSRLLDLPELWSEAELVVLEDGSTSRAQELRTIVGAEVIGSGDSTALTRRRAEVETRTLQEIDRLVRTGRHTAAQRRIRRYRQVSTTAEATAAAWDAAMSLTEAGQGAVPAAVVTDAISAADQAWRDGHAVPATYALGAAMRVLFHPVLHADVPNPPLARDAAQFLRPLRQSQMLRQVLAPNQQRGETGRCARDEAPPSGPDILVLTGSYPRFSAPLVSALEQISGSQVTARSLGDLDRRFNWLGVNTDVLAWRVAAHPAGSAAAVIGGPPDLHAGVLDGHDVIVADWVDRGAMWASMMRPPDARLVLRMHGMDLFSPWPHLVDWSRVDDLIVVSSPLRQLAEEILGDRLDGVRVHVIDHGVDGARFTARRPPEARRTLGMIGWGKLVKDPLWTLDVLEHLLQGDPDWRLLLIGDPLPRDGDERTRSYAEAFWSRVDGSLAAHIELVPQTDDVPSHAARLGFVVSSSRRESFHLAVVEGVLAGAVPIVRDWPVYQHIAGPRAIFPADWVVADPQQAAARIRSLSEPAAHHRAARRARDEALRRFHPTRFNERVQALLAGPRSAGSAS